MSSRKNALAAINETFWVMTFLAALTAVFTFIDLTQNWQADDRLWGFVSAAFLAGIAFGIRQKSRIAAAGGFSLYVGGRIWSWIGTGHVGSIVLFVLVALALWHGVRGTFAFHRFGPIEAGTPSIEDSFRTFEQPQKTAQQESEQK